MKPNQMRVTILKSYRSRLGYRHHAVQYRNSQVNRAPAAVRLDHRPDVFKGPESVHHAHTQPHSIQDYAEIIPGSARIHFLLWKVRGTVSVPITRRLVCPQIVYQLRR